MLPGSHHPLASRKVFARRLARSLAWGMGFVAISLALGTVGYHFTAGLSWVDAELNAAMILTGMGPVSPLTTTEAKLFASVYALFSGVSFLTSVGVIFAPVLHRLLHLLSLGDESER